MNRPVRFEGLPGPVGNRGLGLGGALAFYTAGDFRAPRKGEWYLSGAVVMAYRAPADYRAGSRYRIVTPTHYARALTPGSERGEAITLAR